MPKLKKMETLSKTVAKNLKEFRQQRNITQKQLAQVACYSEASIRKIENNERAMNLDNLQRIANKYDVSITLFFK